MEAEPTLPVRCKPSGGTRGAGRSTLGLWGGEAVLTPSSSRRCDGWATFSEVIGRRDSAWRFPQRSTWGSLRDHPRFQALLEKYE